MTEPFFLGFLDDPAEYERAEAFWAGLWDEVLAETSHRPGEWRSPWFPNVSGDGTRLLDGNPIFSAVSDRRKMGIRVIQFAPTAGDIPIDHWTDTFSDINELVISCAPDADTTPTARGLIRAWIAEGKIAARGGDDGPVAEGEE
jgi:hypothetical protein